MIDYKVGDWVETCHIMPAIVQKIDVADDVVEVFYPHYKEQDNRYTGGSCCSITHCGVHKVDESTAQMMLAIGEERLTRLWDFLKRTVQINSIEKNIEFYERQVKEILKHKDDDNYNHWAFPGTMGKQSYELAFNSFNQKLENYNNELYEAWGKHEELWHQTISDLYNGVVNIITQGVWLSYPKVNIERIEGGFRIITIRTGERFLTKKSRCSKWGQPSNKKHHKHKYTIIKKLS